MVDAMASVLAALTPEDKARLAEASRAEVQAVSDRHRRLGRGPPPPLLQACACIHANCHNYPPQPHAESHRKMPARQAILLPVQLLTLRWHNKRWLHVSRLRKGTRQTPPFAHANTKPTIPVPPTSDIPPR